jgi:hypothetical protein
MKLEQNATMAVLWKTPKHRARCRLKCNPAPTQLPKNLAENPPPSEIQRNYEKW